MKPKGIAGEIIGELKETVKRTGEEVKGQVGKVPQEVVAALTGGQASTQNVPELEKKDRQERAKGIAYLKRVIREEQEAEERSSSAAIPKEGGMAPLAVRQGENQEKKATLPIIKPPGDLKRRLPWQKPVKGRAEIKDVKTG